MFFEPKLKDFDPARLVHPLGDRGELKRELNLHIDLEQDNWLQMIFREDLRTG